MYASDVELFERSVRHAVERHTGEALDAALVELGWPDALTTDPATAVSILFPLQGAAHAASSALNQVVTAGLGVHDTTTLAVVLPSLGRWAAPGEVVGDRLSIQGLGTRALSGVDRALVAASDDRGDTRIITVATTDLSLRPVRGIDPAFGLVEVTADGVGASPSGGPPGSRWPAAVALVQLALSYEILGATRTMLALAREHALDRIQYGQPISKFQAVRHRLAETLVAIEGADAVVNATREAPSPELAAIAKALSGRAALTAARHCQQVLAGIGFTAEHSFHHSYRRVLLLDQLFGSAHSLTFELGEALLRSRRLPALLPL